MRMRSAVSLTATLALTALFLVGCSEESLTGAGEELAGQAVDAKAGYAEYEVTITNLTSGQPLTPPLLAVHRQPVNLFTVGEPASMELQEIAENGNLPPMVELLQGSKHVLDHEIAFSSPPPLMPEAYITATVSGERGAKYLSMVSMLICTNDGFTGLDGVRLPKKVGDTVELYADAYDAGTEENTENYEDLVGPCQTLFGGTDDGLNYSPDEDEVIRHHPGIEGVGDLDEGIYDWTDPVISVSIERTM